MARHVRPTPHRLGMALSLILLLSVALPETAVGKHRRPLLRIGLAAFAISDPPDRFECRWNDNEPVHDYECRSLSGDGGTYRLTEPQPPPDVPEPLDPPRLLQPGPNYHDHDGDGSPDSQIEGWEGSFPLAHPDIAPVFTCLGSDTDQTSEYQCQFTYLGYRHTFAANEIVSVEYDAEGGPGDQFFVPCHRPPAPCVPVDLVPPDTAIGGGPFGTVRSTAASFAFSSSEPGSIFECRLDGRTWRVCFSPRTYSNLSDGKHRFGVRATDAAGNVDETPAERGWRIDTTGPEMGLSRRPLHLSRRGVVKLRVRCLANELADPCSGSLTLKTVGRVRASGMRQLTLGRQRFKIASGVSAAVSVKLSLRHRRLVARRGRLRVRVTIRVRDRLRNVAETGGRLDLRAPAN